MLLARSQARAPNATVETGHHLTAADSLTDSAWRHAVLIVSQAAAETRQVVAQAVLVLQCILAETELEAEQQKRPV